MGRAYQHVVMSLSVDIAHPDHLVPPAGRVGRSYDRAARHGARARGLPHEQVDPAAARDGRAIVGEQVLNTITVDIATGTSESSVAGLNPWCRDEGSAGGAEEDANAWVRTAISSWSRRSRR